MCEQELGVRRPRATGSTLETAGQLVSRPAELPPIRSAFVNTGSEGNETAGVGLDVPGRKSVLRRQQGSLRALPRPFIFMAYCSAVVMNCMAIVLAVVYGSSFQSATSAAWAIATVTSILFEYVLVQPIWLMATAFLQVRLHLIKIVEDELAGNRVHHHDVPDEPREAPLEKSNVGDQQLFDALNSVMEVDEMDSIELPMFDLIPGNIEDIVADRVEEFVNALLAPSDNSTYNFVRDVSEAEFCKACGACGLDSNDERVINLWRALELDERGRAQVRSVFDNISLNEIDKLIATFFLRMDIVHERVRGDAVKRALGGYMEDNQVEKLVEDDHDRISFGELRSRFKALMDVQDDEGAIEEDRDDVERMLETQLATALSRMDVRGSRRQVLLPRQRPYVVQPVADLDEIQLAPGKQ